MKYRVFDRTTKEDITDKYCWVIRPEGELCSNEYGDLIGYPNAMYVLETGEPEKEQVSRDDIVLLLGKWFSALEDEGCNPWKIEECVKLAGKYHYTKTDYKKFLNTIV